MKAIRSIWKTILSSIKGIDSLPQAKALYANVKKVLAENRAGNPPPQSPNPKQSAPDFEFRIQPY